jgi:hypothetical protein
MAPPRGRIDLLCFPRLPGYVFGPPSRWLCRDREVRLGAAVHEVHDTFGGGRAYVLPVAARQDEGAVAQRCGKDFPVAPFIPMGVQYSFRLKAPGEVFPQVIRARGASGRIPRAKGSHRFRRGPARRWRAGEAAAP